MSHCHQKTHRIETGPITHSPFRFTVSLEKGTVMETALGSKAPEKARTWWTSFPSVFLVVMEREQTTDSRQDELDVRGHRESLHN